MLPCLFGDLSYGDIAETKVESEYEYQARLGPRVRDALTLRCAFKWSSFDVLRHMNTNGMDPLDPETDRKMAIQICRMDHARRRPIP